MIKFIHKYFSLADIVNLALRGLSIAGRFVLIFLITYEFTPRELGIFGVFNTSIILAIQLVGLDFYVFTSREFVKSGAFRQSISYNQLCFHLLCYAIALPITCAFFLSGILPWTYFILFFSILVLDHLSNEIYRLLIVFKESVQSSILLFIKSSAWVFFLPVGWFFLDKSFILVFYFWILGLATSLVYGYWMLRKKTGVPFGTFDIQWIINGVKVALPFFVSTLLLKVTEHSSRYFIDGYWGKEAVGVFTFHSSFSNILSTVVFTLVVMPQYPLLLEAFANGKIHDQKWQQKKMLKDCLQLSLLMAPLIILGVGIFVSFYKDGTYRQDFMSFIVLVLANILISVNYVTHYILYAQKKDRLLFKSYLIGSMLTVIFNFLLVQTLSIIGAAIANLIGFVSIVLLQSYFIKYVKYRP